MAENKNGEQEADRLPGMSAELAEVLRATGVRGYDQGHSAGALWWEREPWTSARKAVGEFPGERTAAGLEKAAETPGRESVGTITASQLTEIAEVKMPDLNANDLEAAKAQIEGTARSMGITVV